MKMNYKIFLLILAILSSIYTAAKVSALQCYKCYYCDTVDENTQIIHCSESSPVCEKAMIRLTDDRTATIRGCTNRIMPYYKSSVSKSSDNNTKIAQFWPTSNTMGRLKYADLNFCVDDLCNNASLIHLNLILIIATTLLLSISTTLLA